MQVCSALGYKEQMNIEFMGGHYMYKCTDNAIPCIRISNFISRFISNKVVTVWGGGATGRAGFL